MSTVNKVILVGRLGTNPQRYTSKAGDTIVSFPLATSFGHGERRTTAWHKVKVFGKQAERCAEYLSKGHLCSVEGRINYRRWEKDNELKFFTEVIAREVNFIEPRRNRKAAKEEEGFSEQIPF